jgi:hypothetical protein
MGKPDGTDRQKCRWKAKPYANGYMKHRANFSAVGSWIVCINPGSALEGMAGNVDSHQNGSAELRAQSQKYCETQNNHETDKHGVDFTIMNWTGRAEYL